MSNRDIVLLANREQDDHPVHFFPRADQDCNPSTNLQLVTLEPCKLRASADAVGNQHFLWLKMIKQ